MHHDGGVGATAEGRSPLDSMPSTELLRPLFLSSDDDALPSEVLRLAPSLFAVHLHGLFLKAALRIAQPLLWKGGLLQEIPKASGAT